MFHSTEHALPLCGSPAVMAHNQLVDEVRADRTWIHQHICTLLQLLETTFDT